MSATEVIPEPLLRLAWVLGATDAEGNPALDLLTNPQRVLRRALTDPERRAALFELLSELLAEAGITAPELPGRGSSDPATGWVPLLEHQQGDVTGALGVLHRSTTADGQDAEVSAATHLELALGGRLTIAPSDPDLTVEIGVRVPLLRVEHGDRVDGADPLDAGPPLDGDGLEVTVDIDLSRIGSSSFAEIAGAGLVLRLPYTGGEPDLGIMLRGVRFGDAPAVDLTPQQLVDELGTTGVRMAVALLRAQADAAPELRALLRLLGLDSADAGDAATPTIPAIPVDDLIARGVDALRDWLASIAQDADGIRHWFQSLADLLGLEAVDGTGSSTDPLRACLGSDPGDTPPWRACATLVVAADPVTGALTLVPGLRGSVSSAGPPATALEVAVDLATISLGATPSATALPMLTATARLGRGAEEPPTAADLLEATVDIAGTQRQVRVARLTAGLGLLDGGLAPVLALHDVDIGADHHEVVDLTSLDGLVDLADSAVDDLADVVRDLLGVDDPGSPGRSLAALAGLVTPAGAPTDWPDLVGLRGLFTDPLGSIGRYHARVLDAPPGADGANRWGRLAAEVGTVLTAATGAAAPSVSGLGTASEPWALTLFDAPSDAGGGGRVTALLWATEPVEGEPRPQGRGPVVHLAVEAAPEIPELPALPGDGEPLSLHIAWRATLVRAALPSGTTPSTGGVELALATRHEVRAALGPELVVGSDELQVRSDGVTIRLAWHDGDLDADVDLGNPRIGTRSSPGLPLEAAVQQAVERLFTGGHDGMPADVLQRRVLLPAMAWLSGLLEPPTDGATRLTRASEAAAATARRELGQLADLVEGSGTYVDPWALDLDGTGAELLGWLDPDGPRLGAVADHVLEGALAELEGLADAAVDVVADAAARAIGLAATIDESLRDLLDDRDPAGLITALLALAGGDGVLAAGAQEPGGAAAGWSPTDHAGAHLTAPATFDPAEHLPGEATPERRLYVVVEAAGLAPWATQVPERVVDLRLPGSPPEAVDVTPIDGPGPWFVVLPDRADATVTQSADHPATPPVDGFDGQVGRLQRAVHALADAIGGDVSIIAHGTAGHAAQAVAAGGRVADLVTLATPHRDPGEPALAAARDGLRLLDGLLERAGIALPPLPSPLDADGADRLGVLVRDLAGAVAGARPELDDRLGDALATVAELVVTGRGVLDGWATGTAGATRLVVAEPADLAPPPLPDLPAAVRAVAVRVQRTADELRTAVLGLAEAVARALLADTRRGRTPTHLGLGVRLDRGQTAVGPEGLRADLAVRADLALLRLPGAADVPARPTPHVTTKLTLRRRDGWLVGGPGAGTRVPGELRLRRVDVDLLADLSGPTSARLRFVLHDAGVHGEVRARWVVDDLAALAAEAEAAAGDAVGEEVVGDGALADVVGPARDTADALTAPARQLIAEAVQTALGSADEAVGDPAWRSLRALLRRLGFLHERPIDSPRGPGFDLPTDVLEHWVVDAAAELRAALVERTPERAEALDALRDLLGASGDGDVIVLPLAADGRVEALLVVGSRPTGGSAAAPTILTLRTVGDGLDLDPFLLAAAVTAGTDGRVAATVGLATARPVGALGRPTLALAVSRGSAPRLVLALAGAESDPLGGPLTLLPAPDPAAVLARLPALLPPLGASWLLGPAVAGSPPLRALLDLLARGPRHALPGASAPDLAEVGTARRLLAGVLAPLVDDPLATLLGALRGTVATDLAVAVPDVLAAAADHAAAAGEALDPMARALVEDLRVRARAAADGMSSTDLSDASRLAALASQVADTPLAQGARLGAAGRAAALAARGRPEVDAGLVGDLVDALRDLLGQPGDPGDPLALPWGASMMATADTAGVHLAWARPGAPSGPVSLTAAAELGVRFGAGMELAATFGGSIEVAGPAGDIGLTLGLDDGGTVTLAVRLDADSSGGSDPITVQLLPRLAGLDALVSGLAGQAATALLPVLLDELDDLPTVGPVLTDLGDALELRVAGSWDAAQLASFALPLSTLPDRLQRNALPAAQAFRDLLAPTLTGTGAPPGAEVVVDTTVPSLTATIWADDGASVAFELLLDGTPSVCLVVTGLPVVPPAATGSPPRLVGDLALCFDATGPTGVLAQLQVRDPDWLATGALQLLPSLTVRLGDEAGASGDRVEIGTWLATDDPRAGVFAHIGLDGTASGRCHRTDAGGTVTEDADVAGCLAALASTTFVPLLIDLVLPELASLLEQPVNGEPLSVHGKDAGLLDLGGPSPRLAADALDLGTLDEKVVTFLTGLVDGLIIPGTDPVRVAFVSDDLPDGAQRWGVEIGLTEPLVLADSDDLRLAVTADAGWLGDDALTGGLRVLLVTTGGAAVDFDPEVSLPSVGVRVDGKAGAALLEDPVHLGAVEVAFAVIAGPAGVERMAVLLAADELGIPLSSAGGGDNPTAAKVLGSGDGDGEPVAPTLSPEFVVDLLPDVEVTVRLRDGSLPLWLPVQRNFGPIYLEQVGLEASGLDDDEESRGLVLVDGGLSIDALTVGVDDLGVSIPIERPLDLADWQVVLRGLAIAYDSDGVTVVGGFRQVGQQYAGMVQVQVADFGLTAVGAYGEFPVTSTSDPGDTFTSMFVFGVVTAPLGGPPCFFVTAVGAGFGINRRLQLPAEVQDVGDFTLVRAMTDSGFASDPMASLGDLVDDFPVEQGAHWLAAGVRATSFALVEDVVVLAVEFGNGLEVSLLGLATAQLPTRSLTLASVELALRARFSTREMLVSVEAQLTDNSWILHESMRLTGGFAFVAWLDTGDFVLSLGGYHPSFNRPAAYPAVPRLGFSWSPGAGLTVKGEAYFALTSSSVMAGGRLEAGYELGIVWASFTAGADALLSWDPFFYRVDVYVRVSAGVRWKVCLFGACARINLSFSIGADLSIRGPDLWGRARLDLDVTTVTVTFGSPSEPAPPPPLTWAEFHTKHLRQGDPDDLTMSLNVAEGLLAPDPATSGSSDTPGDGSASHPLVVAPELVLRATTRTPSTTVVVREGEAGTIRFLPHHPTGVPHGIRPMQRAHLEAGFLVQFFATGEGRVNLGGTELERILTGVPEGVWKQVEPGDEAAEAAMREALTGVTIVLRPQIPGGDNLISLSQIDLGKAHPLPLAQEVARRGRLLDQARETALELGSARDVAARAAEALQLTLAQPSAFARRLHATGRVGSSLPDGTDVGSRAAVTAGERRTGARTARPRLAPLGTDLEVDRGTVAPRTGRPTPIEVVVAPVARPPRLAGIVRTATPAVVTAAGAVDLDDDTGALVTSGDVPEVAAPRLEDLELPAHLAHAVLTMAPDATRTRTAAAGTVLGRGRARTPAATASLRRAEEASLGEGLPLTAGEVAVFDAGDATLATAAGDQATRLLALDATGRVLAEQVGAQLEFTLPTATHRVVAIGAGRMPGQVGAAGGPEVVAGLAGWSESSPVVRVGRNALLAGRVLVRVTGAAAAAHAVGLSTAGRAVAAATSVATRLPGGTRSVAVVLETSAPASADLARGVVVDVDGGARAEAPPVVVVRENRVITAHALVPRDGSPLTVTVDSDPRWRVVGVVGSASPPAALVEDLTNGDALAPLAASAAGASTVRLS